MRRESLFFLVAAGLLWGVPAQATHPDHEGERGLELSLSPGLGFFSDTNERIFYRSQDVGPTAPTYDAFTGGFALQAQAGWRFNRLFSAGVMFNIQTLSPTGQYTPAETSYGARDSLSSFHVGVYGRFYPMGLRREVRDNPRVFFNGPTDLRRFEPWVSLGFSIGQQIARERNYNDPQNQATWTTSGVAIPIGLGAEYRLFQPLAVGLQMSLIPIVAATTEKVTQNHIVSTGSDRVEVTTLNYDPVRSTNFQFFLGLSARYTFTLF